ncbi:MAG: DUF4132 domain-containing protein [Phycisphaerae bacterium]|nr:DUF4132 domain-containing protein [Phycisphaerae bacterium]
MLATEQAKEALERQRQKDSGKRLQKRLAGLPRKSQSAIRGVMGWDRNGKVIEDWDKLEPVFLEGAAALDSLNDAARLTVFKAALPKLAHHVDRAWQMQKSMPYLFGVWGKPFRAPAREEATRITRASWLDTLVRHTSDYDEDVVWFSEWACHFDRWGQAHDALGMLFAAAIDDGGAEGQRVFDVLRQSANGEHEIGGMGRHVTRGLLICSRPDAWEFVERLLLAAQRQEGLRQDILETVDTCHPEAFQRMLRLILDENLIRFSATARAANVWFGINWDSASAGVIRKTIDRALTYVEDSQARSAAIESNESDRVYLGLWATAFWDAYEAIPLAERLLEHKEVGHRFTGVLLLLQLQCYPAYAAAFRALHDEDIRVAAIALQVATDSRLAKNTGIDVFGEIEAVIDRFPKKKTRHKALLWPWLGLTVWRQEVADVLAENLGDRPSEKLLPYIPLMSSNARFNVARRLGEQKRQSGAVRRVLFELVGDSSAQVREEALKSIGKGRISDEEAKGLEAALTRKPGDLRRGALKVLLNQPDKSALASGDRLLAASNVLQRQAGLELLKEMIDAGRQVEACRQRARGFAGSRPRFSDDEQRFLDAVLEVERDVPTLVNAFGLMDPAERTPSRPVRQHAVPIATSAAEKCILGLDRLIHEHRETPTTLGHRWRGEEEPLLGNVGYGFPRPKKDVPIDQDVARLPLAEVWRDWYERRPSDLRDRDGLEVLRAAGMLAGMANESLGFWRHLGKGLKRSSRRQLFGTIRSGRIRYDRFLDHLLEWLLKLYPPKGAADFLLTTVETSLAHLGVDETAGSPRGSRSASHLDWRSFGSAALVWHEFAKEHQQLFEDQWSDAHRAALWELEHWIDLPVAEVKKGLLRQKPELRRVAVPRDLPDLDGLIAAYGLGRATRADLYDQVLPYDPCEEERTRRGRRGSLWQLTSRKPPPEFERCPDLRDVVNACRDRILGVELTRGDTPTEASGPALELRSIHGAEILIAIVQALGAATLVRGYARDNLAKNTVFSHLIRVSYPVETDTPAGLAAAAKAAQISDKRLVDIAVYAPQWASMIERALGWTGLAEAVWWLHAHTKDEQWSVEKEVRETWEAEVSERTPLSAKDLVDGAVDVDWFRRAQGTLGKTRWELLDAAAKYASGGSGHRRAQIFADAMLGRTKKQELVAQIHEKRHQDSVRALGLLPLAKGKARRDDLLGRYQLMQEFVRTSRQFGSQRQASEKRAATIGQQNLARTAGYADPIRLQWAMEAQAVADLADGPIEVTVGETRVALAIDAFGGVELSATKNGKSLKTVPAAARKDRRVKDLLGRRTELKRQLSRSRVTLEQMMCRGAAVSGDELTELMTHPLIGASLGRLVLVGEGIMGYPMAGGKALEDFAGKREPVKKGESLRIAHPFDLLASGHWHEWQRDCFAAERIQPFKQVFRELYVLTETEKADKGGSQRYAGHQVNPRQAMALLGSRGWVSHPEEGVRRTFHEEDLSAWIEFQGSFHTPAEVEGLTLESVRFSKRGEWKPVDLSDVPPRLFSEVMRDLDLVVSVAHRGGVDPEASASTVEMRSSLMRETLSVLSVENVRVEKNRALIKGKHGEYSVHLGSAVAHMIGGGALIIVPVHAQHRGRLFLPFADDDPRTAEVLSKVLMLARDHEIKDSSLLAQIRGLGGNGD